MRAIKVPVAQSRSPGTKQMGAVWMKGCKPQHRHIEMEMAPSLFLRHESHCITWACCPGSPSVCQRKPHHDRERAETQCTASNALHEEIPLSISFPPSFSILPSPIQTRPPSLPGEPHSQHSRLWSCSHDTVHFSKWKMNMLLTGGFMPKLGQYKKGRAQAPPQAVSSILAYLLWTDCNRAVWWCCHLQVRPSF